MSLGGDKGGMQPLVRDRIGWLIYRYRAVRFFFKGG